MWHRQRRKQQEKEDQVRFFGVRTLVFLHVHGAPGLLAIWLVLEYKKIIIMDETQAFQYVKLLLMNNFSEIEDFCSST